MSSDRQAHLLRPDRGRFYWTFRGRIPIHAPALKLVLIVFLYTWMILSIPLALVLRFLGFQGPFHDKEWAFDKAMFKRTHR